MNVVQMVVISFIFCDLSWKKKGKEGDIEDGEFLEDEDVGRHEMEGAHEDKEHARTGEDDDDASDDEDEDVQLDKDAEKKLVSKVNDLIKKLTHDSVTDKGEYKGCCVICYVYFIGITFNLTIGNYHYSHKLTCVTYFSLKYWYIGSVAFFQLLVSTRHFTVFI